MPTSATSVCVQGAPGHRQDRGRACTAPPTCSTRTASGCAAAASWWSARTGRSCPTSAQVLPALGELDVEPDHGRRAGRAGRTACRAVDPVDVARAQGRRPDGEVLRRAVWSHVGHRAETLVVPVGVAALAGAGVRRERTRSHALSGAACGTPPGRAAAAQRLAHEVLVQMEREGATTDDRVQDRVARTGHARRTSTRSGRRSTRCGWCCGCSATRRPGRTRPTASSTPRSRQTLSVAQAGARSGDRAVDRRRRGARRRGSRPAWTGRRASVTSCSTRPRTSRRCSCAPSGAAARPARPPCSATSPRARRRGPRRRGTTR